MSKKVIGSDKECYLCRLFYDHSNQNHLHRHHLYPGGTSGRRNMSEKYGLAVMLCPMHHNASNEGVHSNRENDLLLKRMGQEYYESHYGSREDFIRDFIKSYL